MQKVRGVFVIIRALGPLLAFLVLVIATVAMVSSVIESARVFGSRVDEQLAGTKQMFTDVTGAFDDVGVFVGDVAAAVDQVGPAIASMPTAVVVATPEVRLPQFVPVPFGASRTLVGSQRISAEVPGTREIKTFFGDISDTASTVTGDIGAGLESFFAAPTQITEISAATTTFADDLRGSVLGWLSVLGVIAVVAVIVWIAGSISHTVAEVRRGIALIRGEPIPAVSIVEMTERLRSLEADLAALTAAS